MPATPPLPIGKYELDKNTDELIINIAKNFYSKYMKNKNNIVTKTKNGLPVYKCINKINGSGCKADQEGGRGTGLVLQKNQKCFHCQFDGAPWLQTDINALESSSQLLPPVRSPSSPRPSLRHSRSASFGGSPTSSTFSEESQVDPYMFARPFVRPRPKHPDSNSLKRSGAIYGVLGIKKKEDGDEDILLDSEDLSNKLTIQITQFDSETSTLDKGKGKEKETEVISGSSRELVSSPLTPHTPGGISDRIKSELVEILEEAFQRIINVKEEKEIEKMRSRLETLLVENQKLKDDNEHLTQRVKELERKVDLYEAKETIEIFKRESVIRGSIDEQDIYLMYEDMVSLQIDIEDKKEQDEFVAEIEITPHSGTKK